MSLSYKTLDLSSLSTQDHEAEITATHMSYSCERTISRGMGVQGNINLGRTKLCSKILPIMLINKQLMRCDTQPVQTGEYPGRLSRGRNVQGMHVGKLSEVNVGGQLS